MCSRDFLGDVEALFRVPAEPLLDEFDLIGAQRRAMRFGRILHVRTAIGNVGAKLDQRRPLLLLLGAFQRLLETRHIVAVAFDNAHVPAIRLCSAGPVSVNERSVIAIDADVIVVVNDHEILQAQVVPPESWLPKRRLPANRRRRR